MSLEQIARTLYDACPTPKPNWSQLGTATRSVWLDRAKLKVLGHPQWWSVNAESDPRSWVAHLEIHMDNKQLADLFDELSETMTKIAGTFRGAGSSQPSADGDAGAGRKVRKPAKPAPDAEEAITEDTVREALKKLADEKGAGEMKKALESVGAGRLSDVDEDQYEELMANIEKALTAKKATAPKKGKKAEVTFDEVSEAFKTLLDEDRAAAKRVLKGAGVGKLSELEDADADTLAEVLAAIKVAGEEDDLVG